MKQRSVLIAGAGVAGLALAWWLDQHGFAVTIVEKAPGLRDGGHAVDVRGTALQVTKAMGIHDALVAHRTRFDGMSMLDRDGKELSYTPGRTYSGGALDNEDIELFRDDLCRILLEAVASTATLHFNEQITGIDEVGNSVLVSFRGRLSRAFDMVVGADGIYSALRHSVLDPHDDCLRPLGGALALYTAPNTLMLRNREWMYREAELGVVMYPDAQGDALRVGVGFGADVDAALRSDIDAQKRLVLSRLQGLGGRFLPLLAALHDTGSFYFGELAQVQLAHWSRGRVALVGDAAYCASPFSGQGTSLALVGACVLAHEMASAADAPAQGFARYQARMQPYVGLNQALVDLTRQGPIPDVRMAAAANAIDLPELQRG